MNKPLPALTKTLLLARKCAAFAGRTGGPSDHASLPVPVPGETGVRIAMLLVPSEAVENSPARRLKPPTHVASMLALTGAFAELAAIEPAALGLKSGPGEPLGEVTIAADRGSKRLRLCELMDEVLPTFATGRPATTAAVKSAARELRALWNDLAEPPLVPCYRALGPRFFGWLDSAAAP